MKDRSMNYIIIASLSTSVIGLIMIYFAALNVEPEVVDLSDISQELVGRTITVEGHIANKRTHEEGHIFLTISDGTNTIQSPIFSNVAQHLNQDNLAKGRKVRITGLVDDYRNQIQIIPRKPNDIFLAGD